jgi:glyoxylase-like metal-dependent hydrolase (beta-lactamase superfamily II)
MAEAIPFKSAMEFAYGVPRTLSPGVVRVVANNPSPFTYKGTNSYLIGSQSLALIDPGPADASHLDALLAAAAGRPITHVLITHTHRDHVEGLAAALAATGAKTVGFGPYELTSQIAAEGGESGHRTDRRFAPDVLMKHGERLAGADWAVTAVHTPGHTPDHLCFALEGTGVLFSGDHVMAWNTSVVAPPEGRMGDYCRSLEVLMERLEDRVYYPGHGGQLENPQRMARAFLTHRRMREQAILEAVREGCRSVADVTARVYAGLDEKLIPAARLSVLAHVEHLWERGLVKTGSPLSPASDLVAV